MMAEEEPTKMFSVYNQQALDYEWRRIKALHPVINKHPLQRLHSPSKTFSAAFHVGDPC